MSSDSDFEYDVFLSHSAKDKDTVRDIANRLKSDGVRVWFDEWLVKPGDSTRAKIEEGLERSRVLVLCLSAAALAADWPQLESHTFRFKDPLNHDRRFIPLRLDDAPIKGSLAQFLYINWRLNEREQEYPKLLEACRTSSTKPAHSRSEGEQVSEGVFQLGYTVDEDKENDVSIRSYAFSNDGTRILTGAGRDVTDFEAEGIGDTSDDDEDDWHDEDESCVQLWDTESGKCQRVFYGHTKTVWTVAWSADQNHAVSGSADRTIRMWNVESGTCLRVFEGHTNEVNSVAWSNDQRHVLSGSDDRTMRLWDVDTGRCLRVFEGHAGRVWFVLWSGKKRHALSSSGDATVRLWDLQTGQCLKVLEGHEHAVRWLAWDSHERQVLSASFDKTIRIWDLETGRCVRVLEGHTDYLRNVTWHAAGSLALSCAADTTVRLWNCRTGICLQTLEGHAVDVSHVAWSNDGLRAFSGDKLGGVRVWDLSRFLAESEGTETPATFAPAITGQVQYTNAKVLLVGNSAAGKTGLSNRLALGTYKETDSTVGAWATQWKLPLPEGDEKVAVRSANDAETQRPTERSATIEREVWLWDFGGQADQRLIHQLYMDQTQVAALVFDPQKPELLDTLGTWDRDLTRATTQDFKKLLVAGRTDAGGLRSVSRGQVETFAKERGFAQYLETSAKENVGCEELKAAIIDLIDWDQMTKRTSPALFKRLKEEIVRLKEEGRVLMRFNELREALTLRMTSRWLDQLLTFDVGYSVVFSNLCRATTGELIHAEVQSTLRWS